MKFVPLHVTASRTGFALQRGLRGARVIAGAPGTYVSLSPQGYVYRRPRLERRAPEGGTPAELVAIGPEVVLQETQEKARRIDWNTLYVSVCLVASCLVLAPLAIVNVAVAFLAILILVVVRVFLGRWSRRRRTTTLFYDVDQPALLERAMLAAAAGEALSQSSIVWQGTSAGVDEARAPVKVSRSGFPGIRSNLELWGLPAAPVRLLFLPDFLFVAQGKSAGLVPYEQLGAEASTFELVERAVPARDARRVGSTWQHTTKSGAPDRRYRHNPEFPVVQYGRLTMTAPGGLRVALQTSRVDAAQHAAVALTALARIAASEGGVLSRRNVAPSPVAAPAVSALEPPRPANSSSHDGSRRKAPPPIPSALRPPQWVGSSTGAPAVELPSVPHGSSSPARWHIPQAQPAALATAAVVAEPAQRSERSASPRWLPAHAVPKQASRHRHGSWVPPGSSIRVADWVIPGGMLYVGDKLAAISGYGDEPALISPGLRCSSARSASREDFGYWPSYSQLRPEQRAAYLNWLAAGRSDPDAAIGCPFLFLYGIERRLLHDLARDPSVRDEAPLLLAEVDRLLSIYGPRNNSFLHYAREFLTFCRVSLFAETHHHADPPLVAHHEVPITVKMALGQLILEGEPVPARWSLAWYMTSPDSRLRTPARRCHDEFVALFETRFRERFGDGLRIKPNKTPLRIEYRPASASFGRSIQLQVQSGGATLPDVTRLERPFKQIAEIAAGCMDALDAYSRALGPEPTDDKRLRALALLPKELATDAAAGGDAIADLSSWLAATTGRSSGWATGSELTQRWLGRAEDRLSTKDARLLSMAFERLGYAMEPDPRFGGGPIKADSKLVVFELPPGAPAEPSAAYASTGLWLHLAALVALADGRVDPEEEKVLRDRIDHAPKIDEATRRRLFAHVQWLLESDIGMRGLAKRVEALPRAAKEQVAQLAVAVAGADGRIAPAEVKVLSRIYKLLGIEDAKVFEDIHELQATGGQQAVTGPVRVSEAAQGPAGRALPPMAAEPTGSGGFVLDMNKVRRREAESQAVSELLANIFEAESDEAAEPVEPEPHASACDSMTNSQSALLHALSSRPSWPRAEFDALAQRYEMMPAAALDMVNEIAIEQCGDPVLVVDGDRVEVEPDIMKEMMADV